MLMNICICICVYVLMCLFICIDVIFYTKFTVNVFLAVEQKPENIGFFLMRSKKGETSDNLKHSF